ncbi:MAG TPA: hypothetical protein VHT24_15115 [Pseudacidobacterium sp.]|jgi:uncharacterized protein (UPF0332 family)|nr:hypothetical protein [Pseudacidobacterium sp.]
MATKAFDWPDYLTLADELSKRTEEYCLRTAVSRAYYYIFHLARQRIIDNRFPISRDGYSHKQIWEKFENDPDPRCQKLYTTAKKIHDKRKQADYDIPYPRIEGEFPAVIELAQRFAQELANLDQRLPVNRGIHL